jgi:hypothetical protein
MSAPHGLHAGRPRRVATVPVCAARRDRAAGLMWVVVGLAVAALLAAVVVLLGAERTPSSIRIEAASTDGQYLGALSHGGICCSSQRDVVIWHGTPADAISLGHSIAKAMVDNPTYAEFNALRAQLAGYRTAQLNGFETGELIVVAVHYYAPRSLETTLINDVLGTEAGYWYGTESSALRM